MPSLLLNWKLDGFVDEQRYYCSEAPIDINNLPTPKAVLANDIRAYTDTTILANKIYYVHLSSVKNSVEKLSAEKRVSTSEFQIDLKVESGALINNGRTDLSSTWVGIPSFEADAMVLNGTQWLDIANNEVFNFGTGNFEITFELMQTNQALWRILMSAIYYSGTQYSQFGFNAGKIYVGESWGGSGSVLTSARTMTANSWHTVKLRRQSPTLYELVVDGVVVASRVIAATVTFNFNRNNGGTRLFNITWSNQDSPFIGKIRRFTLKR